MCLRIDFSPSPLNNFYMLIFLHVVLASAGRSTGVTVSWFRRTVKK